MTKDRPELIASASLLTLGRVVSQVALLVAVSVLAYNLSKEDFALYAQAWLVAATFVPMMTLRLPDSLQYFVPQLDPGGTRQLVARTFLWLLGAGVAASFGIWLLAKPLAALVGNPALADTLSWFCLLPLLAVPAEAVAPLLITMGRARAAAAINALSGLARLAVVVPLVLLTGRVVWVLAGLLMYQGLRTLILWLFAWRAVGPAERGACRTSIKAQLRFSLPLVAAVAAGLLLRKIDMFVVMSMFSAEQFAVYRNGAFEFPLPAMLAGAVMAVLIPRFVKLYQDNRLDEINAMWAGAIRKTSLVIFPMAVGMFVFAEEIVVLLFSSRYADSAAIFRVMALVIPLRVTVFNGPLTACGRTRLVTVPALAALVVTAILCPWLASRVGLMGPAIAMVIATGLMAGLNMIFIKRLFGWSVRRLLPWMHLFRTACVAVLAGAGGWLAAHQAHVTHMAPIWRLLIGGLAFGGLYVGLLLATNLLSWRECRRLAGEMIGKTAPMAPEPVASVERGKVSP